jgi:hypothetical protein
MRNSYTLPLSEAFSGHNLRNPGGSMKAIAMILILFSTVSAFAGCESDIDIAVEDTMALNAVLASHNVPEELMLALKNEKALHRQVILNCKVAAWETKQAYCSVVPKLVIKRYSLIKSNPHLSKREKGDINFLNDQNKEYVRIVCP